MSLLMDELKKAERSPRAAVTDVAADVPVQAQTPVPAPAPPAALSSSAKPVSLAFVRLTTFVSGMRQVLGQMGKPHFTNFIDTLRDALAASSVEQRVTAVPSKWLGAAAAIAVVAIVIVVALHGKNAGMSVSEEERKQAEPPQGLATAAVVSPPSLQRAEAALKAGKTEQARTEYQRLLSVQPDHLEALRGLATISQQAGQNDVASGYYQHILRIAPQDIQAQLAWVGVQSQSDPSGAESRLKALISTQPRLASAHEALGSLYARQNRWNEAQAAFLQAYRNDPDNPDILYSLAISYDHLQQVRQALMFYRLAQRAAAAATHPVRFDQSRMNARIETLNALLEP